MSTAFRRPSVSAALALLALYFGSPVANAQKVVRWVDSQGQVHYSDHAPPEASAETVTGLPKSPPPPPPPSAPTPAAMPQRGQGEAPDFRQPYDPNEVIGGDKYGHKITRGQFDKEEAARAADAKQKQDKLTQDRATAKTDAARKQEQADRELVAACYARRETYCSQDAAAVRRYEAEKAWHLYDVETMGRMVTPPNPGGYPAPRRVPGPPPKEPPMPRPEDPAKAEKK